jgi:hypothetical protein
VALDRCKDRIRRRGWRRQWHASAKGSTSGGDASGLGRGSGAAKMKGWLRTCLWVACYARCQPGPWDSRPLWLGLEPSWKFALPLGLLFL